MAAWLTEVRVLEAPATIAGFPGAAIRHAHVILLAAACLLTLASWGRIGGSWLGRRGEHGSVVGLAIGLAFMPIALLGLALVGLWFPPLILALALLPAVLVLPSLIRGRISRPAGIPAAGRALATAPVAGMALAAVLALWLVPLALTPETDTDCFQYHLSVPEQYLLRHGAFTDRLLQNFKLPLPAEMVWGVVLAGGNESAARALNLAFGVLAIAALFMLAGLPARDRSGWLAGWLLLTSWYYLFALSRAKNDAASVFLVAAALLARDRGLVAAAWTLAGAAFATKYTTALMAPVILAWPFLRHGHPLNVCLKSWSKAALGAVAVAPWWGKNWLAFGNPLYFWLNGLFPTLDWDEHSAGALRHYVESMSIAGTAGPLGALMHVPVRLALDVPGPLLIGLAALLPGAPPAARRLLWTALVLQWLYIWAGRGDRFPMPADFTLALAGAMALASRLAPAPADGGAHGRRTAILFWLLALPGFLMLVRHLPQLARENHLRCLAGEQSPAAYRLWKFGALGQAQTDVRERLKPRRVLLLGEFKSYRFGTPAMQGTTYGHPPLIWRLVREARTPGEMRKRLRQLGDPLIVHNFMSSVYDIRSHHGYDWTPRMLVFYRDFVRAHYAIAEEPAVVDGHGGGFYIYRLDGPGRRMKEMVYYLPGAEGMFTPMRECEEKGDPNCTIQELLKLHAILPDVGHVRTYLGYNYHLFKEWKTAYEMYRSTTRVGMIDEDNWFGLATCALMLDRYDETVSAYEVALRLYPGRRESVEGNLATMWKHRADDALRARRTAEAADFYGRAAEHTMNTAPGERRTALLAHARVMRAMALAQGGKAAEARAAYAEAVATWAPIADTEEALHTLELLQRGSTSRPLPTR